MAKPITEWEMAMICSMHGWRGTSIVEGALKALSEVYPDKRVIDTTTTIPDIQRTF